jgi:hypothetical protein
MPNPLSNPEAMAKFAEKLEWMRSLLGTAGKAPLGEAQAYLYVRYPKLMSTENPVFFGNQGGSWVSSPEFKNMPMNEAFSTVLKTMGRMQGKSTEKAAKRLADDWGKVVGKVDTDEAILSRLGVSPAATPPAPRPPFDERFDSLRKTMQDWGQKTKRRVSDDFLDQTAYLGARAPRVFREAGPGMEYASHYTDPLFDLGHTVSTRRYYRANPELAQRFGLANPELTAPIMKAERIAENTAKRAQEYVNQRRSKIRQGDSDFLKSLGIRED